MSRHALPTAVLTGPGAGARVGFAGRRRRPADDVASEPYELKGDDSVILATVATTGDISLVVELCVRGAHLVIEVAATDNDALALTLIDELGRIGIVDDRRDDAAVALTSDQRELLTRLAAGETLATAAARMGWSRRTATRRLAEARSALGVQTTAEALAARP